MKTTTIKITVFLFALITMSVTFGQTVTDYLDLAKPILFDKMAYKLTWSSHPTDNYFKQEYISTSDNPEKFKRLLTFDVLIGNRELKDIVTKKVEELNDLKQTDPIINYRVLEKGNEIILDFILGGYSADGKSLKIIERNVYRYTLLNKDTLKGILLFAVSDRAYDNEIDDFLSNLKNNQLDLLNAVSAFNVPEVTISK